VNILVDTSVWSLALRRAPHDLSASEKEIVGELAELINEGRARIIGLVRQELLSGIKTAAQFAKLRDTLSSFPDEEVDTADYELAAALGNRCRSRGLAVSIPDMLICSVAQARAWSVFSTDPDFKRYAGILSLKLHEVRR